MITPAVLIGPLPVPNAAAVLYTSPANTITVIARMAVANVGAAAARLTLWVVRSGGARADSDIVVGAAAAGQVIPAGPSDPVVINAAAGLVLAAGDAIHGLSDTAAAINIVASGWTQ